MDGKTLYTRQRGFSLIELIIVLLTIAIIAAIAIPNILATRRSANEGSAISSLRILHGAQFTYLTTAGGGNYAGTTGTAGDTAGLAILQGYGLIDNVLASGTKSGYSFRGAVTPNNATTPATFFFSANPLTNSGPMKSGSRRFCVTQQGVLYTDQNNLSTIFDPATCEAAATFDVR